MPHERLNNSQEIVQRLKTMEKFTFKSPAASDVIPGVLAVDALTVAVTTLATFATNDHVILIGSGGWELTHLGVVPVSGAIPLKKALTVAQAAGAIMHKATRDDLGYVENAGISISASTSKAGVGAANALGNIAYIDGDPAEPSVSFALRESNLRNILTSFGVDENAITGDGTATKPYVARISVNNIGTQTNLVYRGTALLVSGRTQYVDFLNCAPEIQVSTTFGGKGNPAAWGVAFKYTDMLVYDLATPLT